MAATTPQPLRILEVGCGHPDASDLSLHPIAVSVTGVDNDEPALRSNAEARDDLEKVVLGDLRTVPLAPRSFDIAHASFLVERTPNAEVVLDHVVSAVRPGGLILLRIRDRRSAYGFLDRKLPLSLRAWLRRRLAASRPQATPVFPPLPAVYEPIACSRGIHLYCLKQGLTLAEEHAVDSATDTTGERRHRDLVWHIRRLVDVFSRGRLSAGHDQLVYVIRKPENRFARVVAGPEPQRRGFA